MIGKIEVCVFTTGQKLENNMVLKHKYLNIQKIRVWINSILNEI